MPGVERVDTIRTENGYEMKSIWCRSDLSDTSMMRLSTATGYLELLRLQDRFVYLPEMPYRKVDLDKAMRNVLTQEKFEADGGQGSVCGWLSTVTVENIHPNTTVALRMKGLSGSADALKLYGYGIDGTLKEVPQDLWHIQTESGETPETLSEDVLYEIYVSVQDGGDFDLSENEDEKEIKISVVPVQ